MIRKPKQNNFMKIIPITVLSLITVVSFLISGCNASSNHEAGHNGNQTAAATISTDSLINNWNQGWNNHDSKALTNSFTDNSVVVFSSKKKFIGANDIMNNWINKNLPSVKNLKTEKISASASSDMAFFNGTYTLDITRNDSLVGNDAGCFTIIWKQQQPNDWKVELMIFGVNAQ